MYIYVSVKYAIIGSGKSLSPVFYQAILNDYLNQCRLIVHWTQRNKLLIKMQKFFGKKMHLEMLSAKYQPFCRGLTHLVEEAEPGRVPQ